MSKNHTFLLIEDDFFLRSLMKKKIETEGYGVIEAEDGMVAIEKLKKEKISLVLLDLLIPGIDGFEILEIMSKDSEMSKIPVIVLSNFGQKEKIDKAMSLGAKDYIVKAHFAPSEIIEVLKKHV